MSNRLKIAPLTCKICNLNVAERPCDLCQKIICMKCLNSKFCTNCCKKLDSFRLPRKVLEVEEVSVKKKKCWNCIN